MFWLVLVLGLALTALTGAPVGIGLALTGLVILHFLVGGMSDLAVTAVYNVFTSFTLSAVPIFIFLGHIMMASGLSDRLYTALTPLFQRIPGKLLHTNIAVCMLFGAVSGASMSTAAAVGSVAYPEMKKRGYDRAAVVGTLAAGGTLGLLIPPSLALLIYGATMEVSIGQLFLAGILPGVMLAGFMMVVILFLNLLRRDLTPDEHERMPLPAILRGFLAIWPLPILIFAVIGTIYMGWATPTEAAALGVAAAIIVGFLWGDLTLQKLWQSFVASVLTFGAVAFVVLGALILAQAVSVLGIPREVIGAISEYDVSPYMVLAFVVVVYIALGCFFDGISLMLITLPIVFPVLVGLGFDPVWLGVIITILIEIGMLTPPVGINLYVIVGITKGDVSLGEASKAAFPYWLVLLFGVLILTIWPQIALFLPSMMN